MEDNLKILYDKVGIKARYCHKGMNGHLFDTREDCCDYGFYHQITLNLNFGWQNFIKEELPIFTAEKREQLELLIMKNYALTITSEGSEWIYTATNITIPRSWVNIPDEYYFKHFGYDFVRSEALCFLIIRLLDAKLLDVDNVKRILELK